MEGGREQNFWPGFVDALSNVVLVMIFVVVVFVVTLFYYSQKLAQFKAIKFIEKKEAQEQVATPSKNQPAISHLDDGDKPDSARFKSENEEQLREIAALKGQVAVLKQKLATNTMAVTGSLQSDASAPTKAIEIKRAEKDVPKSLPGVRLDGRADALTLHFDRDGVELDAAIIKTLDNSLAQWVDSLKSSQAKLVVTGIIGTLAYTEGKRRAYYRAIAVRNHLMDLGVPANRIVSRVVPGKEAADNDATVLIQYMAAKK